MNCKHTVYHILHALNKLKTTQPAHFLLKIIENRKVLHPKRFYCKNSSKYLILVDNFINFGFVHLYFRDYTPNLMSGAIQENAVTIEFFAVIRFYLVVILKMSATSYLKRRSHCLPIENRSRKEAHTTALVLTTFAKL